MSGSSLLRQAMAATSTSQSDLARMSGIKQPSISQFLAGRIAMSDAQLERLLRCMGWQLVVDRRADVVDLTRSERRSWLLHRELARALTPATFESWVPSMRDNLSRQRELVRGEPHLSNLQRWEDIAERHDIDGLRSALTGIDRAAIEMREVSPMSGLLDPTARSAALARS